MFYIDYRDSFLLGGITSMTGDLLMVRCWVRCFPFEHYGIDMGDGTVIELASDDRADSEALPDLDTMRVRRRSVEAFARGKTLHTIQVPDCLPSDEVLRRAESKLNEPGYCLVSGNCEHFARWCKTGRWVSEQIDEAKSSFLRSLAHVGVVVGSAVGARVAKSATAGTLARSGKSALPSLAGEMAEQIAKRAFAHTDLPPEVVNRRCRAVGYGTVAAVGILLGGPTGSLAAIATHATVRR